MTRPPSRWGCVAALIYVGLAVTAVGVAVQRLAVSTEMPGLAAWELLVLALPWTLVLETSLGRQADGFLSAAIVLGAVALNTGFVYVIGAALERLRRDTASS
jgi:hypothetical protein